MEIVFISIWMIISSIVVKENVKDMNTENQKLVFTHNKDTNKYIYTKVEVRL